ncbi:MAG: FHIPEP family type III secretion protein [Pyrinomonadaceae bacterium]
METLFARSAQIWREIVRGDVSPLLTKHSDLLIAVGMMGAIGMIIFPIPTPIISLLLIINLVISLVVVLVSLYISSPVQLASYPTILLLTTLLRFCLSISVTRAILSEGRAGAVVETLGQITGGGDRLSEGSCHHPGGAVYRGDEGRGALRRWRRALRLTRCPASRCRLTPMRAGLMTQDQARRAPHYSKSRSSTARWTAR